MRTREELTSKTDSNTLVIKLLSMMHDSDYGKYGCQLERGRYEKKVPKL